MKKSILILITVTSLISCIDKQPIINKRCLDSILINISNLKIDSIYRGYWIAPWTNKVHRPVFSNSYILYQLPGYRHIFLEQYDSSELKRLEISDKSYMDQKIISDYNLVSETRKEMFLESAFNKIRYLQSNDICGVKSNNMDFIEIFMNYYDSTYNDIKEKNSDYFDFSLKDNNLERYGDKPYKCVFVKIFDKRKEKQIIDSLRNYRTVQKKDTKQ